MLLIWDIFIWDNLLSSASRWSSNHLLITECAFVRGDGCCDLISLHPFMDVAHVGGNSCSLTCSRISTVHECNRCFASPSKECRCRAQLCQSQMSFQLIGRVHFRASQFTTALRCHIYISTEKGTSRQERASAPKLACLSFIQYLTLPSGCSSRLGARGKKKKNKKKPAGTTVCWAGGKLKSELVENCALAIH